MLTGMASQLSGTRQSSVQVDVFPNNAAETVETIRFAPAITSRAVERPRVRGKFLYVGREKLWVRGVTYGTFRPDADGDEYPARAVVESDFSAMVAHGFNAVRAYTLPPVWLLDCAARHGLRVMLSLAVER